MILQDLMFLEESEFVMEELKVALWIFGKQGGTMKEVNMNILSVV